MAAIGQIPEAFSKPPSPAEVLELYKQSSAHRPYLPPPTRREAREEAAAAMEIMRNTLAQQEPAPPRLIAGESNLAYVSWVNVHRHALGMRPIRGVKADGSYEL